MPVSSWRAPVRIEMDTATTATPRPAPAMSIPGRTSLAGAYTAANRNGRATWDLRL